MWQNTHQPSDIDMGNAILTDLTDGHLLESIFSLI